MKERHHECRRREKLSARLTRKIVKSALEILGFLRWKGVSDGVKAHVSPIYNYVHQQVEQLMFDDIQAVWFNGRMIPVKDAVVPMWTHGLHYGTSVFEGIRSWSQEDGSVAIFRLRDHCQRLSRSAKIACIPMDYSAEQWEEAILQTVEVNNLTNAYIRPLAAYGCNSLALNAEHVDHFALVVAWNWGLMLNDDAVARGLQLKTVGIRRTGTSDNMAGAKVGGLYVKANVALHEARAAGADEALILDEFGFVSETSGQNLFALFQTPTGELELVTPSPTSCLRGITRSTIMTLAKEIGLPVRETMFTPPVLYDACEVFITGTATGLVGVAAVDGHEIRGVSDRSSLPAAIRDAASVTSYFRRRYFDICTGRTDHRNWLFPVGTKSVSTPHLA